MDSIAVAWWLRPDFAVTVDYGQLAADAELAAAAAVCAALSIEHVVLVVDTRSLGSGDMAGAPAESLAPESDWWPCRNQLLVTLAAMRMLRNGVQEIVLGTVSTDASHRDGSAAFVYAIDALMQAQEGSLRVSAPALSMTTVELIRTSGVPRSLLAWAHSCHKATVPCGQCRGCNKYYEVMHLLEASDGNGAHA